MVMKTSLTRPKTAGSKRTKTNDKSFNRDISPNG